MNKSEFVTAVAKRAEGDVRAAHAYVEAVFETIAESLAGGEKVVVTGFGTFERVMRPARTIRNPRTGAPLEVGATHAARFTVGQTLRSRMAATTPAPAPAPAAVPAKAAKASKAEKTEKTEKTDKAEKKPRKAASDKKKKGKGGGKGK